jgi:hypothetical protein
MIEPSMIKHLLFLMGSKHCMHRRIRFKFILQEKRKLGDSFYPLGACLEVEFFIEVHTRECALYSVIVFVRISIRKGIEGTCYKYCKEPTYRW